MTQTGANRHSSKGVARFARYFPSRQYQSEPNATVMMFAEDIYRDIMPIGGKSRSRRDFAVQLNGDAQSNVLAGRVLESLASRSAYDRNALSPALMCDAVSRVAAKLAINGRAAYEIIKDTKGCLAYQLMSVPIGSLHRCFQWYVQIIPKADRETCGRSHSYAPERNVWCVSMPQLLGGYRKHRKVLAELAKFPQFGPQFLTEELSNPVWRAAHATMRYIDETEFHEARVTSSYGWDRRDYSTSRWTEFYFFQRRLKFRWAQACIREHVIDAFNSLFQRLNLQSELVVQGLPTVSEILKIRRQMRNGRISFTEASDSCLVF